MSVEAFRFDHDVSGAPRPLRMELVDAGHRKDKKFAVSEDAINIKQK